MSQVAWRASGSCLVRTSVLSAVSSTPTSRLSKYALACVLQDPYAHPLYSSTSQPHRLLLKVARGRSGDNGSAVSVTVVRRLPVTCAFPGMADFQVSSADAPRLDRAQPHVSAANIAHTAEPMRDEQRMLVLPPMFSVAEQPFKYGYKAFARKEPRAALAWLPGGKQAVVGWGEAAPAAAQPMDAKAKQVCSACVWLSAMLWPVLGMHCARISITSCFLCRGGCGPGGNLA